MRCPVCQQAIVRAKGPFVLQSTCFYLCRSCWESLRQEAFFERMDWLFSNRPHPGPPRPR